MKTIVCILAFACLASALPQRNPVAVNPPTPVQETPAASANPASPQQQQLGPQFYGPGLNNQFAIPPNPLVIETANQILSTNPNLRVRIGVDGEAEFTDQFGQEVEVVDNFGREPLEIVEDQIKRQNKLRRQQLKLQRQQAFLSQLGGGATVNTRSQATRSSGPQYFFN